MTGLPIDAHLPEIIARLGADRNLVIVASPGAGKTTRVPPALLDSGLAGTGEIWVLEPRRLAARLAANRVAEERGESLGESIGYQVRFEDISGPATRVRFVTEGILTRRLLQDPELRRVGLVVLDEFHERHLQGDLALALLKRLQHNRRPDLRLVVMSATIDAHPVQRFLGNAPALKIPGRMFDIDIEYAAQPETRSLEQQVAGAVERLIHDGLDGDTLVFLPGAAEIRRATQACQGIASREDLMVAPLHGELSPREQDRAVRPSDRRKIILSTNVAESSVTIDGVTAVIDSGLARTAGHSPWSGLPHLAVARISQASAVQRAGRAGRTRPGRCLRLYTAADFSARPAFDLPETARSDLAEPVLELHAAGISDPTDPTAFEWYEAPPREAIEAAETLLRRLGAVDDGGSLTMTGRQMLSYPLHPRLSRLFIESVERGAGEDGATIAALIGERDIVARDLFGEGREPGRRRAHSARSGPSDLIDRLDRFREAERANFSSDAVRRFGLDPGAIFAVDRVRRRLLSRISSVNPRRQRRAEKSAPEESVAAKFQPRQFSDRAALPDDERERALLISILTGYPDRVARKRATPREKGSEEIEVLLSGGGQARLAPESIVNQSEFLVAVEAEERRGPVAARGRASGVEIRTASAIEVDWLLDLYLDRLREVEEVKWNAASERVDSVRQMRYDQLVIDETRVSGAASEEASRLLFEKALGTGIEAFIDRRELDRALARMDFVAGLDRDRGWPVIGEREAEKVLAELCRGRRSFADLREAAARGVWRELLLAPLTAEQRRVLERRAPERVQIGGRRQVRIEYERGKTPWIASRLQDFFGLAEGPRIADGKVALVMHLLAPNQRPVQVTADLAGFWTRHYPQARRELGRRYPRHAWPEDPLAGP